MEDLAKRFLIGGLSEDAYGSGTDGTLDLTAGDDPSSWQAFREQDSPPFSEVIEQVNNEEMTATHSTKKASHYGQALDVSFEFPLKGKRSAAGDPPFEDYILKACNLEETIVVDTSAAYRPVTGDDQTRVPSMALVTYMYTRGYDDAYRWVAQGVRGNLTITLEMGENALCEFSGRGLFNPWPTSLEVADNGNTLPTTPTEYSGEKSTLEVIGLTFQIDDGSGLTGYDMESMTLESAWDQSEDMTGTKANRTLEEVFLTRGVDSPPGGSMTLKGRSATLSDLMPLVKSGAEAQIQATLTDGTDTVEINIPIAQFSDDTVSLAESTFDLPYAARGDFGSGGAVETDFELTYT